MPRSVKSPVKQKSWRPTAQALHSGVQAWAPDHRDDEVAALHARDARSRLDDAPERLVPDDEVGRARGRAAVLEPRDLAVGAAQAHVQDLEQHVAVALAPWLRVLDDLRRPVGGKHGDGAHDTS